MLDGDMRRGVIRKVGAGGRRLGEAPREGMRLVGRLVGLLGLGRLPVDNVQRRIWQTPLRREGACARLWGEVLIQRQSRSIPRSRGGRVVGDLGQVLLALAAAQRGSTLAVSLLQGRLAQ